MSGERGRGEQGTVVVFDYQAPQCLAGLEWAAGWSVVGEFFVEDDLGWGG
jgi:hypothetical protein